MMNAVATASPASPEPRPVIVPDFCPAYLSAVPELLEASLDMHELVATDRNRMPTVTTPNATLCLN